MIHIVNLPPFLGRDLSHSRAATTSISSKTHRLLLALRSPVTSQTKRSMGASHSQGMLLIRGIMSFFRLIMTLIDCAVLGKNKADLAQILRAPTMVGVAMNSSLGIIAEIYN